MLKSDVHMLRGEAVVISCLNPVLEFVPSLIRTSGLPATSVDKRHYRVNLQLPIGVVSLSKGPVLGLLSKNLPHNFNVVMSILTLFRKLFEEN